MCGSPVSLHESPDLKSHLLDVLPYTKQHLLTEFEAGMHYLLDPNGLEVEPVRTYPSACPSWRFTSEQVWGFSFLGALIGAVMSLVGALAFVPFLLAKRSSSVKQLLSHVSLASAFAVSLYNTVY
jgi:hypothetical protein